MSTQLQAACFPRGRNAFPAFLLHALQPILVDCENVRLRRQGRAMLPLSVRVLSFFFLVILLVSFCIRAKMFQKSPSIRRQLDSDSMNRL